MATPKDMGISVIFPLVDGRLDGVQAVRSWTHLQTMARDRYQVIAVSDGSDPDLEKKIAPLLASHDQLVRHPTDNFIELYDVGLRVAQGRLIVLTEHHCIADPHCLTEVEEHFRTNDDDGACLNIEWVCMNEVARLKWNERNKERLSFFKASDHWNKFLFAGFAARRETMLGIGGIDFQYGLFLELAVGAQLHHAGYRLGHIPNAIVQHLDNNSFGKVLDFIGNFTRGEILFLAQSSPDFCRRYIGVVPEWMDRHNDRLKTGRRNVYLLSRVLCNRCLERNFLGIRGLIGEWFHQLILASVPLYIHLWAESLGIAVARARFAFWRFSERRRIHALNDACNRMVHLVRSNKIRHLSQQAQLRSTKIKACRSGTRWIMEDLADGQSRGIHAVEQAEGEIYRWSEPIASVDLDLIATPCELVIHTGGLRGKPQDYLLACFWNDEMLTCDSVRFTDESITLSIPVHAFVPTLTQRLTIVTYPLLSEGSNPIDKRRLGMPILSIEVHALSPEHQRTIESKAA